MTDLANTPAIRAAMVIAAFRDSHPDTTLAAVATADGGAARLTHGDLRTIVGALLAAENRLDHIASWHSREVGQAGMVGEFCATCGERSPCETRRMADGTHEDLQEETS